MAANILGGFRYVGGGVQVSASSTPSTGQTTALPVAADSVVARWYGLKTPGNSSAPVYVRFLATGSSTSTTAALGDVPINPNETIFLAGRGFGSFTYVSDAGTVKLNVYPIEEG